MAAPSVVTGSVTGTGRPGSAETAVSSVVVTPLITPTLGNLLWVTLSLHESSVQTITPPSGWTQQFSQNCAAASAHTLFVFYKVVGASEPASYTFSWTTAGVCAWGLREITGQNATTPVDSAGSAGSVSTTSVNPQTTATLTPSQDNCLLLADWDVGGTTTSFTVNNSYSADGFESPTTGTNQSVVAMASLAQTTAAATNVSGTMSTTHSFATGITAIAPAASAADPFPAGYQWRQQIDCNAIFRM